MQSEEIRKKFLDFFKERGHTVVPSSSLIPDDPSVLLTTAGMQQFKKYYTGELNATKDFGSKNTVSIQKSFRTSDIDEVGDESHLTFFEMLGNFSFGGYWKEDAIKYAYEFITGVMNLPISYVTVFRGSDTVPKDNESRDIWKSIDSGIEIREEGMEDVFWGPTGSSGPCGPTTEIYCKNAQGKDIEIWNIVFNEFFCDGSREALLAGNVKLTPLPTRGIDTGMGLERLAMISQGTPTIFETDLFAPIVQSIVEVTGGTPIEKIRLVADHLRAVTFVAGDGIEPSNTERGYILRRLIRRAMVTHYKFIGAKLDPDFYFRPVEQVINRYGNVEDYRNLKENRQKIFEIVSRETNKFAKTLERGVKELEKTGEISGAQAFDLYQSYGLPPEITQEFKAFDWEGFNKAKEEHIATSAIGQEAKFGGHGLLLDTGELKAKDEEELKKVTRLHTATHMLQQALREILGPEVKQAGSDITVERTRFDFTFPRKLTPEEIHEVEVLVNQKIKEDLPMQKITLPKADAEKTGALYFFKEKYPDPVNVYFIGSDLDSAWSKEFCGGPHVTHTGEVGEFEIVKEEAVGSGTRRIRAIVKP